MSLSPLGWGGEFKPSTNVWIGWSGFPGSDLRMRRVETSTATDGDGLASGQMDAMILVTIVAGHREDPQPGDPSRFLRGHRLKTQKERGGVRWRMCVLQHSLRSVGRRPSSGCELCLRCLRWLSHALSLQTANV